MKFYKYCSFNPYILSDIKNNRITLSKPRVFNDPFDCLCYINKDKINEYQLEKSRVRDITFIVSLTNKFDEPIMWSHYSDSHFGFCIEYEIPFRDTNITQFVGDEGEVALFKVIYSEEMFDATNHVLYLTNYENYKRNPFNNKVIPCVGITEKMIDFFKYKDKKWEYEQEYRLSISGWGTNYKDDDRISTNSPKIIGIYFGERSGDLVDKDKIYYRDDLKRICEDRKIPTYIMKKHDTEYKMIAEKKKVQDL